MPNTETDLRVVLKDKWAKLPKLHKTVIIGVLLLGGPVGWLTGIGVSAWLRD
jgi:hypothetical protein